MILSSFFVLLILIIINVSSLKNNVCWNWPDYYTDMDANPNCFYTPDMYMDVPESIQYYFGKCETHEIPTEDGYFVTTFKIPRKKSRGTILLRHPALSDSVVWTGLGNYSIAKLFWDEGYELWMTNSRGTYFSSKHVNLTKDDYEYWNFSFHENAIYDLRAALKYVYKRNGNRKMIVLSHSMGSTESLIYASLFPKEANKYVKLFIPMSPSSFWAHGKLTSLMAPLAKQFQDYAEKEKIGDTLVRDSKMGAMLRNICLTTPDVCVAFYSTFGAGRTPEEDNPVAFVILAALNPRGLSIKSVVHYGQGMSTGKFRMFDYGMEENMRIYGSQTPPDYPVEKIETPTLLVYSPPDDLAPVEDIDLLYDNLQPRAKKYGRIRAGMVGHADAIFGKNRNEKIYFKILNILRKL